MASRGAGGRVLACGHERDTSPHLGYTPSLPDVFRTASACLITKTKQRVAANTDACRVANTRIKPAAGHPQPGDTSLVQELHFCRFQAASTINAAFVMY